MEYVNRVLHILSCAYRAMEDARGSIGKCDFQISPLIEYYAMVEVFIASRKFPVSGIS